MGLRDDDRETQNESIENATTSPTALAPVRCPAQGRRGDEFTGERLMQATVTRHWIY